MGEAVQLVWFKRDLRIRDHAPLRSAAERGPVMCLYIHEPALLRAADSDVLHVQFVHDCLDELTTALQQRGATLQHRTGDAVSVLESIRATLDADGSATRLTDVWAHEETTGWLAYQRDRAVRRWARASGIAFHELPQTGVIRRLPSRDGWASAWTRRMAAPPLPAPARLPGRIVGEVGIAPAPSRFATSLATRAGVQRGGESVARETLRSFVRERGIDYRRAMSSPVTAPDACSRISAWLSVGALSLRTAEHTARARLAQLSDEAPPSVDRRWLQSLASFRTRLRWHCHFMQKLEDEPQIEFTTVCAPFRGIRDEAVPRTDWLDAWHTGQTGVPLIDACMRSVRATGWLPFRMRAMVFSYASHHLWLHWRFTAPLLARHFLDFEPGIHYAQSQMQSGVTGINAIRIYNPEKQALEHDPTGAFIRRWVPELINVPTAALAAPHRMPIMLQQMVGCVIGVDYPAPLVDNATAMRAARDKLWAVRHADGTCAEALRVYQKHGSRREPFARRDAR
jgi:deoxyribodipyrimidine photo-lyase